MLISYPEKSPENFLPNSGLAFIRAFNREMTSLVVGMVTVFSDLNGLFCTRFTDLSEVEDVVSALFAALSVVKKLVVISGEIKSVNQ